MNKSNIPQRMSTPLIIKNKKLGITPGSTEKAKDGTVWFHHKVGDFSAHSNSSLAFVITGSKLSGGWSGCSQYNGDS